MTNLPHCPYCGMKLMYFESLASKNSSFFKCPSCLRKSKIVLNPLMFKLLGIVEIIAVIAFVAAVFMGCGYCLIGIIFITLIFGIFYAYTPFMMNLRKYRKNFYPDENPKKEENTAGETTEKEIFNN